MSQSTVVVSPLDVEHLRLIRANVDSFLARCAERFARPGCLLLDIAPQDHAGAAPHFIGGVQIETLDINPAAGCTYTADICRTNKELLTERFDYVVCTEVLEHTLEPFAAAAEIWRILKPGGLLFASTPFNFRIHGPLPDCWRFTEHGLRALFKHFQELEIEQLDTPQRDLMPIHYTVVARK